MKQPLAASVLIIGLLMTDPVSAQNVLAPTTNQSVTPSAMQTILGDIQQTNAGAAANTAAAQAITAQFASQTAAQNQSTSILAPTTSTSSTPLVFPTSSGPTPTVLQQNTTSSTPLVFPTSSGPTPTVLQQNSTSSTPLVFPTSSGPTPTALQQTLLTDTSITQVSPYLPAGFQNDAINREQGIINTINTSIAQIQGTWPAATKGMKYQQMIDYENAQTTQFIVPLQNQQTQSQQRLAVLQSGPITTAAFSALYNGATN